MLRLPGQPWIKPVPTAIRYHEERSSDEVRGATGSFGNVCWSPKLAKTVNPAFDVTPAALLEGIILDTGVYGREEIKRGALQRGNEARGSGQ